MDLEKRLYEALKLHRSGSAYSKPDLFKTPPVGQLRQTDCGPIWMVETIFDEGYMHGRVEITGDVKQSFVEVLDPACGSGGFDFKNVAVVDTETTGLAGGTGTYPFIIGVGFWSEGKFLVRQYILRDFSEEPAQLQAFERDLSAATCLLTYNGKAFDIPLLRTRYRLNRMEIPFEHHPHLDLIHPCRRLYSRHFESFNLRVLEAMLFGFARTDDIPSYLIPRIYFDFLQNRDEKILLPILNHNRDDIVSLYLLAQQTCRQIEQALCDGGNDDLFLLSLGKVLFRTRDYERCGMVLEKIKTRFVARDVLDEVTMLRALVAKRTADWETDQQVWREMVAAGRFGCYPHVELAKHLEHREKNIPEALRLTDEAFRYVEFEREIVSSNAFDSLLEGLKRRRRRLLRKLNRNFTPRHSVVANQQ